MKKIALFLALVLVPSVLWARVELPPVMGSNMVLQRNAEVNIWGRATRKKVAVTTSWDGKTYVAQPSKEGKWLVRVTTPGAGGPYEVTIDDGERVVLDNILIGEVWLCSGQSNMELPVMGASSQPTARALETLLDAGSHPGIRLFNAEKTTASTPQESVPGRWEEASMASVSTFSCVGYHFALTLHKALNVPVGIIEAAWGGSRIESWMSVDVAKQAVPTVMEGDEHQPGMNRVGALYNGMLMPLSKYTIQGFLWYQAESNIWNYPVYGRNQEAMVAEWRKAWGGELPFYFVQLPPYDYDAPGWRPDVRGNTIRLPLLQEQQMKAAERIPNSGIAVTVDLGDAYYIHPPVKDVIGQRLALLALSRTYHAAGPIDDCGPVFEKAEFADGRAVVSFRSRSTLLPTRGTIRGFEIAGADKVFYPADAHVEYDVVFANGTNRVAVSSEWVKTPVAVRYAFRNLPCEVNLTNTIGLPAYPFRTDDWNDIY